MRIESSVLLLLSIWAGTFAQEFTEQEVLEGMPVTLPCQIKRPIKHCHWSIVDGNKNCDTQYSEHCPTGYRISDHLQEGNCSLHIAYANSSDEGHWICTIPPDNGNQNVQLTVIVPPRSVYMAYNGTQMSPGEFKKVVTASEPVKVDCVSVRSRPPPQKIDCTVNGEKIEGHWQSTSQHEDKTTTVWNSIYLRFPPPANSLIYRFEPNPIHEKEVVCSVLQNNYQAPVNVTATFAEAYATTAVRLTAHPVANDNSKKFLVCEANGVPEPKYYIQKISSSTQIPRLYVRGSVGEEDAVFGQNRTVTQRGTYVCRAKYPGNALDVVSNQVRLKFGKEDDELTTVYQSTTASSNTGAAAARSPATASVFILLSIMFTLITR